MKPYIPQEAKRQIKSLEKDADRNKKGIPTEAKQRELIKKVLGIF